MNSLYETIKKYGTEKGERMMWDSVALISDAVDRSMPSEAKEKLVADIYGLMSGKHYNEEYAMKCVSAMYYIDEAENKHGAPYWTPEQVRPFYESVSDEIPTYNEWDYYVTFHMIASVYWILIHEWWSDIDDDVFAQKVAEMSFAWLTDKNWRSESKIWDYKHLK